MVKPGGLICHSTPVKHNDRGASVRVGVHECVCVRCGEVGAVNAEGEDERTERGGRRVPRRDQRWQSSKSWGTKTGGINETCRRDRALMGGMTLSKILQISFLIASNLFSRRGECARVGQSTRWSAFPGGPALSRPSFERDANIFVRERPRKNSPNERGFQSFSAGFPWFNSRKPGPALGSNLRALGG